MKTRVEKIQEVCSRAPLKWHNLWRMPSSLSAFVFLLLFAHLLPLPAQALFSRIDPQVFEPDGTPCENNGNPCSLNTMMIIGSAVFNGRAYIGTWNEDQGCMVYRIEHSSGSWQAWKVIDPAFGGVEENATITDMIVFDNRLYVGTWYRHVFPLNDRANLWRTKAGVQHPQGQTDWERVDPESFDRDDYDVSGDGGLAVTSMAVFEGWLYAGIFTLLPPCGVWRSPNGVDWELVNWPGFGRDGNTDATNMNVFGDHLFVGTENGWAAFLGTGTQIWRTDGETMDQTTPGHYPNMFLAWDPLIDDGFGRGDNQENAYVIAPFQDYLFVGTRADVGPPLFMRFDGNNWQEETFSYGMLEAKVKGFTYHSDNLIDGSFYVGTVFSHETPDASEHGKVLRYDGSQWYAMSTAGFLEEGSAPGDIQGVGPILLIDKNQYGTDQDYILAGTVTKPGIDASLWVSGLPTAGDGDNDAIPDVVDNCPYLANPSQSDEDGDDYGMACDCKDNNASIHPAAPEICNHVDDNCNGMTDEGCADTWTAAVVDAPVPGFRSHPSHILNYSAILLLPFGAFLLWRALGKRR